MDIPAADSACPAAAAPAVVPHSNLLAAAHILLAADHRGSPVAVVVRNLAVVGRLRSSLRCCHMRGLRDRRLDARAEGRFERDRRVGLGCPEVRISDEVTRRQKWKYISLHISPPFCPAVEIFSLFTRSVERIRRK